MPGQAVGRFGWMKPQRRKINNLCLRNLPQSNATTQVNDRHVAWSLYNRLDVNMCIYIYTIEHTSVHYVYIYMYKKYVFKYLPISLPVSISISISTYVIYLYFFLYHSLSIYVFLYLYVHLFPICPIAPRRPRDRIPRTSPRTASGPLRTR
jgi:hypothetical protein